MNAFLDAESLDERSADALLSMASEPILMVLTDRHQIQKPLPEVVESALSAGAIIVVFREKDLADDKRSDLFRKVSDVTAGRNVLLIVAGRPISADDQLSGLHLTSTQTFPLSPPPVVGRSCHTLADVQAAEAEGCTYVTLSPIFLTRSKPGYGPALGTEVLREISAEVTIPVIALGGITPNNARDCIQSGGAGVAVMGSIMRSDRPEKTTADLLATLSR